MRTGFARFKGGSLPITSIGREADVIGFARITLDVGAGVFGVSMMALPQPERMAPKKAA